ncbi:MAG: efflux RND transporter periplasmic adaptor subunit [Phycisphaerae bacterium]
MQQQSAVMIVVLVSLGGSALAQPAALDRAAQARSGLQAASEPPSSPAASARTVTGFTAPARVVTLAALEPGRIQQICVAEGELVAQGQSVFSLEADVRRIEAEMARVDAESTLEVDLARVAFERAHEELSRLARLSGADAASPKEVADARTTARSAELSLAIAHRRREQALRQSALQSALLARMTITAPFTGFVTQHLKHEAETVEERESVATLAQLDLLLATIDCPIGVVHDVHVGQELMVTPADPGFAPRAGRVVLVGPVADAASQTVRIKLNVDNADLAWTAGVRVDVTLPDSGGAAPRPIARASLSPRKPDASE